MQRPMDKVDINQHSKLRCTESSQMAHLPLSLRCSQHELSIERKGDEKSEFKMIHLLGRRDTHSSTLIMIAVVLRPQALRTSVSVTKLNGTTLTRISSTSTSNQFLAGSKQARLEQGEQSIESQSTCYPAKCNKLKVTL